MRTALFYVNYIPVLFSTVKLSQVIHRFKIGIFCVDLRLYFQVFPINKKIFGFLNVALAGLLSFSQLKKKMKN